jgi:Zn-dependent protease
MLRSWKLGKPFGIGLYVHWSFLLLPLFVWFSNLESGVSMAMHAVAMLFLLFGCVVLHEYGHALMARHFGIPTRDITLYPIGGVARLERMSEKPWEEFWIAVAGPAVNVVIAVLLAGIIAALMELGGLAAPLGMRDFDQLPLVEKFAFELLVVNVFLVAFNMLPAFPMDGGRVLRALLATQVGRVRATEIAAIIAWIFAGLFCVAGWFSNPFLILIGLMVLVLGQQELAMVRYRAAHPEVGEVGLDGQRPVEWYYELDRSVVPPEPNFSGYTWDKKAGLWIEWREGRPIQASFMQ